MSFFNKGKKDHLCELSSFQHNIMVIDHNDAKFCKKLLSNTYQIYNVHLSSKTEKVINLISQKKCNCFILEEESISEDSFNLLDKVIQNFPYLAVILLTEQGDERLAVKAIKSGAENFLIKTELTPTLFNKAIEDAIQKKSLEQQLKTKEIALIEKEAELESTLSFQNLIIESMPEYLFVKNNNYELVKVNSAFLNLYPKHMHETLIGTTTFESYPEAEVEDFLAMDKIAFKEGYSETFETVTFPSGELRTLFTTKTRFIDSSGDAFILGIARDVTERELLIKQLLKSNKDLEQFAYIASHDLKSPLHAILKLVSWIKEDNKEVFDNVTVDNFNLIENRATRMSALLTDLLNYSRLNKQCQEPEYISMANMKRDILELVSQSNKLTLNIPDIDVYLPKIALQIILVNLISNSLKHTDKQNVEVNLTIEPKTAGYQLTIKDNGPGIDFTYKNRIFDMFQTLKPRDEVEGSGMGLAIVKKVISYYGGTIELINLKDGANFQLFWPVNHMREKEAANEK